MGSGFAGALAAWLLARLGRDVLLLERGRHPRFALGESSTPLAAIALERLAARYDLPDLHALAAYGRWLDALPELRRGLKRGFTFYAHRPGEAYTNRPDNDARLLVAASPEDRVADAHWLRQDVDHFLVRRAVEAGVDYRDEVALDGAEQWTDGLRLTGTQRGRRFELTAGFVVDASGPGGFLARHLPIAAAPQRLAVASGLVGGHFRGVRDFAEVAAEEGAELQPGPYPDDRAAVHHLLAEGWMYLLPFDHGVASAGFLLAGGLPAAVASQLELLWRRLLERYPSIARQLADARPVVPLTAVPRLQHRLARAAGKRWLLLPHAYAFVDPMYSTGIAWSLLGVERLARLFEDGERPTAQGLERYDALLADEVTQIDRLIHGAYLARTDFRRFAAHAQLYFAAASYAEARQRLLPGAEDWAWDGFLGSRDPLLRPLIDEAADRLEVLARSESRRAGGVSAAASGGRAVALPLEPAAEVGQRPVSCESSPSPGPAGEAAAFERWIADAIAPRNLAGLADPARHNLYPVDLEALVTAAPLLGLTEDEVRAALPRLRGVA